MNKKYIKFYYILIILFFFTFFLFNATIEFFTINNICEPMINDNDTNVILHDNDTNVVLHDIVSQDSVNNSSLDEKIDLKKPISLRDDKEFQESIARMEELVEYSRNYNITTIPEQINIEPIINIGRDSSHPFSYNYFDDGLDVKLNKKSRLHIAEYSHTTVCNEPSVNISEPSVRINESVNINEPSVSINESSVNVDDEDTESDKTVISDTQLELDFNEDEVYPYSDSDSESNIGHSPLQHLPPQEFASTSTNVNMNKTDSDTSLKAFLDKTDKEIDKSNVPALKGSYTKDELGLGHSNIPYRPNTGFSFPTSRRFALYEQLPPPSGISSNLPLIEQRTSTGENNYTRSYLGSLNDPELDKVLNINSNNTINTNEADKETLNVSETNKSTTSMNRNDLKKKRMNQIIFKSYGFR